MVDREQSPVFGFDCSGFVGYVLRKAGLYIPDYLGMDGLARPIRHTNEFWDHYGIAIGCEPEGGDLIFFSRDGQRPTHMGLMLDSDRYIHAPGKNNTRVTIEEVKPAPITDSGFTSRQIYKSNPIGFKAPVVTLDEPNSRYHQRLA